jgi:hypothetical protein
MKYSNHARRRLQQRGIPDRVVELILSYGDRESASRGRTICCVRSQRTRRELSREAAFEGLRNIDRYLRTYVVVAPDTTVVTVGHRYRRVKTAY